MPTDLEIIYDNISELVRPQMHTQTVTAYVQGEWRSKSRQVEMPSLIDQLQSVFVSSSGEQTGTGFGSRPNARVDAMDVLMRIDTEAGNWIDSLGHTIQHDIRDNLRWLNAKAPNLTDLEQLHWLALDIRGWGTWARVVTGWEVPAFRPNNTCPLCAQLGGLRIRVIETTTQGMCIHCGEHWTPEAMGLLEEHIKAENEAPGKVYFELSDYEVPCPFCKAEEGAACRSGLDHAEAEPHESRRALAKQGTYRRAS